MAKNFKLEIHSTEGTFYDGEVEQFNLRLSEGYIGILADHSPLSAIIKPGKFSMTGPNAKEGFFSGGIMVFENNQAQVIAEKVYTADNLPTGEAESNISDIEKQLSEKEITPYKKAILERKLEFWKELKNIKKV